MAPLHAGARIVPGNAMHQTVCSRRSRVAATTPSDFGKMAPLHAGAERLVANAMHQTVCSPRSRVASITLSEFGKMAPLHAGGEQPDNAMHQTVCSRRSRVAALHRTSGRWHRCDGDLFDGQCDAPDGTHCRGWQRHPTDFTRWHHWMLGPEQPSKRCPDGVFTSGQCHLPLHRIARWHLACWGWNEYGQCDALTRSSLAIKMAATTFSDSGDSYFPVHAAPTTTSLSCVKTARLHSSFSPGCDQTSQFVHLNHGTNRLAWRDCGFQPELASVNAILQKDLAPA